MAPGSGLNILGLVLASWASETAFGQGCSFLPQEIFVSKWYNKTVTSPGYPSDYDFNLECSWLFQANYPGYIVKVTFNDFQVGQNSFGSCFDDKLSFYDGNSTGFNFLGFFCGKVHPEVIYSTGHHLYVKLLSDNIKRRERFSLSVSAVLKEEAAGVCRKTSGGSNNDVMQLSGPSGTIFSPYYPYPYPSDSKCIWVISVPSGKIVKLTFQDYYLGTRFTHCRDVSEEEDFVEIRDGKDSSSKELVFYCGYHTLENLVDLYSTGNHMRVTFSSTSFALGTKKGFKARYEVSEPSSTANSKEKCYYGNANNEKLSLSGTYGTLESPKEGSSYPPNMRCDWLITVTEGKIVKLSFYEFQLESDYGSCSEDYVEVRDGKESYSTSKGKFCGLSTPADILSSGRYMRVSFRSDSDSTFYDGFKATFTAEEKKMFSSLTVFVIVFSVVFVICTCGLVCVLKCRQTRRNQSAAARISMATQTTASMSQTTQSGVIHHPTPFQQPASQPPFQSASNPYPPPPVIFAPAPSNAHPPPSGYPYPLQPPPPYPGEEQVPQYPPPGQSYPWQQSTQVEPSALPMEQ